MGFASSKKRAGELLRRRGRGAFLKESLFEEPPFPLLRRSPRSSSKKPPPFKKLPLPSSKNSPPFEHSTTRQSERSPSILNLCPKDCCTAVFKSATVTRLHSVRLMLEVSGCHQSLPHWRLLAVCFPAPWQWHVLKLRQLNMGQVPLRTNLDVRWHIAGATVQPQ